MMDGNLNQSISENDRDLLRLKFIDGWTLVHLALALRRNEDLNEVLEKRGDEGTICHSISIDAGTLHE